MLSADHVVYLMRRVRIVLMKKIVFTNSNRLAPQQSGERIPKQSPDRLSPRAGLGENHEMFQLQEVLKLRSLCST